MKWQRNLNVYHNTHSNKSSLGPLHTVEFGPMAILLLLHGDLNSDLLSESHVLRLSLVTGAAEAIVLIIERKQENIMRNCGCK